MSGWLKALSRATVSGEERVELIDMVYKLRATGTESIHILEGSTLARNLLRMHTTDLRPFDGVIG